jgi:hypothetical protein
MSPGLTGIPLRGLLGEFIRVPHRVPPLRIAVRDLLDVRQPPFSNTRLCSRSWLIVTDSTWRALQQAVSLAFAICCVSEVAPPFIPVVLGGVRAPNVRGDEMAVGRPAAYPAVGVADIWSSTTVDDSVFCPTSGTTWRGLLYPPLPQP